MDVLVFVSSHCSHCPGAERVAKKVVPEYYEHGVTLKKVRTRTSEGKELASRFNIRATPTILVLDDNGGEAKRLVGVPSEDSLRNEIEKGLGLKKSLIDRLLGR